MSDTTRVYNSTGKLKRILLGKPEYIEILPISDVARDLYDSGVKRDRSMPAPNEELADVFRQCEMISVGSMLHRDSQAIWHT